MVLSNPEREEIERELGHYPQRRAAAPEALRIVQAHRGWVPDEAVVDVANLLGMTPTEVEGVATFYSMIFREPVGRHVISVCDSVSCWLLGSDRLIARLQELLGVGLGETTIDRRFTLLPAACLGACDLAPALMIDDDLHGPVAVEQIEGLLERYP